MRIAMIGRDLPRSNASGGVAGQMHLLARALGSLGNHVTVFALAPPAEDGAYQYLPIPLPAAVRRHRRTTLYLTPWFAGRLRLEGFDVIHAHGEDQFLRTRQPVVRTFYGAERSEARYSTSLSHRLYHLSMVPFEWVSRWRASAVVLVSRSTQRYFAGPVHVIPCGYDPAVFRPGTTKSLRPSILFVGDLGTRKRAELLLRVFAAQVRAAVPEAELWMVTTAKVAAPGVLWYGRLPTGKLADLYRKAWIFCMPSSYEGFGVPYLEAMASGTPVVATPNGGAEEVLDEGRAGRIVGENILGAELVRLLSSDSERAALAASGLERAKECQISRIAERYLALYQRLVSNADLAPSHPRIAG